MASVTLVEMGETGVVRSADARLQAYGLGACVGLCLFESAARIAVLVHIVLPHTLPVSPLASRHPPPALPGKCADTAVAHALAEIIHHGGKRDQVQAAIVGGAQIFTSMDSHMTTLSRLEIGTRNVLAVKEGLSREGIPLGAEETGGHFGRTVTLVAATGDVLVRPVGLGEHRLATLGRRIMPAQPALEGAFAYGH